MFVCECLSAFMSVCLRVLFVCVSVFVREFVHVCVCVCVSVCEVRMYMCVCVCMCVRE